MDPNSPGTGQVPFVDFLGARVGLGCYFGLKGF